MKRVLILNHFAGQPSLPGGTRHVEMFSRLLGWSYLIVAANHASVGMLTTKSTAGFLALPSVHYWGNGLDRIANWVSYTMSSLARLSLGRRPNVVYASSPHLLTGLSGWFLARRWRVPFVLEIRDLWPQVLVDMGHMQVTSPIFKSLSALESFLYDRADQIVVMAEGTRAHLVSRGVPAERIDLIPNAADPGDFVPAQSREELRSRYGFTRFTCVYTGAHGPANGLDLLLQAALELRDQNLDIALVGTGPSKTALEACAREMELTNVRFLDPIPKAQIPGLLNAADIGLHVLADVPLFRYGISPNKVFDYLAAGLPMLTNVPGEVSELVVKSGGGLAVKPKGLAHGIRDLAQSDRSRLSQMSSAGRTFMKDHHSHTAMVSRLQNLLDRTVGY